MTAFSWFLRDAGSVWVAIKTIGAAGRSDLRVLIVHREAPVLFRYVVERYFGPADEDEGVWPEGFWDVEETSGYYQTADDAVRTAVVLCQD